MENIVHFWLIFPLKWAANPTNPQKNGRTVRYDAQVSVDGNQITNGTWSPGTGGAARGTWSAVRVLPPPPPPTTELPVFDDNFESGDTSKWPTAVLGGSFGHSLTVNNGAAMEGNFGLEVTYTSQGSGGIAYVEDDTPSGQPQYKGSFLLNPNNIDLAIPSRIAIFQAFSPTPASCSPSVSSKCDLAFYPAFALYMVRLFPPSGLGYGIQGWVWGNLGGPSAVTGLTWGNAQPLSRNEANRICFDYRAGNPGALHIAVRAPQEPCPSAGNYDGERTTVNSEYQVNSVRMGGIAPYGFGMIGIENTMFFDQFESFITVQIPGS